MKSPRRESWPLGRSFAVCVTDTSERSLFVTSSSSSSSSLEIGHARHDGGIKQFGFVASRDRQNFCPSRFSLWLHMEYSVVALAPSFPPASGLAGE